MESSGEKIGTRFNSITPLILKLRDIVFGERRPDLYTRISCYLNLVIWFSFFLWHIIGYTAISLRGMIFEEKKIDVEALIFKRGETLGFRPYQFLNLLMEYHLVSSICWAAAFVSIVLMWRRKKIFIFLLLASLGAYLAQLISFMGWTYFMQDTTFFDKIMLAVIAANSLVFAIFMPHREIILPEP